MSAHSRLYGIFTIADLDRARCAVDEVFRRRYFPTSNADIVAAVVDALAEGLEERDSCALCETQGKRVYRVR